MRRRVAILAVCLAAAVVAAREDTPKGFKTTVMIRGVVTEKDVDALRAALKKVPAIKVNTDDLSPGEKGSFGHHFSPPFVIEFTDPRKTNLGAVAKAVAAVKTSKGRALPPSLNLVLYPASGKVEEDGTIPAVREALGEVNGVDARSPGGTVGNVTDAFVSIRLDNSGESKLADILAALKKADLDFRVQKP